MLSSRPQDQIDVTNIIRHQGNKLDDAYILDWLRRFETAIDSSMLVSEYRGLREQNRHF